jgi:hypothetical protein
MALTESKLRQIIREEAAKVMKEAPRPHGPFGGMYDDKKFGDQFRDDHHDDEFGDDRAARDHFGGEFDDDSDDEHDAMKDYAAVSGRDFGDVYRDRMGGRLGRRR